MPNTNGPIFKGRPSPGLKRMRQMSPEALAEHLDRLRVEADALERRLAHLRQAAESEQMTSPPAERIKRVAAQRRRLQALIEVGGLIAGQRP
jgi:ribosomal protein L29